MQMLAELKGCPTLLIRFWMCQVLSLWSTYNTGISLNLSAEYFLKHVKTRSFELFAVSKKLQKITFYSHFFVGIDVGKHY